MGDKEKILQLSSFRISETLHWFKDQQDTKEDERTKNFVAINHFCHPGNKFSGVITGFP